MLSLAMVLILIVGINYVFRTATDAVGAGNALNSINSDSQATQPMIFDDLRNVSKNPPCFIISSQLVTQFLNSDDAKTSSDPTIIVTDNAGNYAYVGPFGTTPKSMTVAPTQYVSPATLNGRNHRADMLKFFAHALYQRRSGPDGRYYASDSSNDAFIEYGHAALPSNDLTAFYGPTGLPNATTGVYYGTSNIAGVPLAGVPRIGAYASDWVLTRRVTLLKDPNTAITLPDYPYPPPSNPAGITAWTAQSGITKTSAFGAVLPPLSYGSFDGNGATQFQSSRYDVAGITPEYFDRLIANAILPYQSAGNTGASLWWNPLIYALPMTQSTATPPQPYPRPAAAPPDPVLFPPYVLSYYGAVPGYATTGAFSNTPNTAAPPYIPQGIDPGLWYNRPQCNPTISTPVTAASLAEMAPYFLQHCSQFVVEYAGDYMQQNNNGPTDPKYGAMTGLGPDGQIDFYVDANGNKHIRWYGMPRSSTGTAHAGDSTSGSPLVLIRGYDPTTTNDDPTAAGVLNYFTDVIPLRDYYTMFLNKGVNPPTLYVPPWEVDVNFDPTRDYGSYLTAPTPLASGNKIAFNDPNNPPRYVAAWHDDMPAMIRILIKVDDPNNKVKDGPWYEYVFRLK